MLTLFIIKDIQTRTTMSHIQTAKFKKTDLTKVL